MGQNTPHFSHSLPSPTTSAPPSIYSTPHTSSPHPHPHHSEPMYYPETEIDEGTYEVSHPCISHTQTPPQAHVAHPQPVTHTPPLPTHSNPHITHPQPVTHTPPLPTHSNPHPCFSHPNVIILSSPRDNLPIVSRVPIGGIDLTPVLPQGFISDTRPDDSRDSKGEKECRRVLEMLYRERFDKRRDLPWLINDLTGNHIELDGYCPKYGIAFEYMGEQHYKSNHHWNKNFQAFVDQAYRDEIKIRLCDSNGVYLITVPYNVKLNQIEAYIKYYLPHAVLERQRNKGG
jgi:hypothetical protein